MDFPSKEEKQTMGKYKDGENWYARIQVYGFGVLRIAIDSDPMRTFVDGKCG